MIDEIKKNSKSHAIIGYKTFPLSNLSIIVAIYSKLLTLKRVGRKKTGCFKFFNFHTFE